MYYNKICISRNNVQLYLSSLVSKIVLVLVDLLFLFSFFSNKQRAFHERSLNEFSQCFWYSRIFHIIIPPLLTIQITVQYNYI